MLHIARKINPHIIVIGIIVLLSAAALSMTAIIHSQQTPSAPPPDDAPITSELDPPIITPPIVDPPPPEPEEEPIPEAPPAPQPNYYEDRIVYLSVDDGPSFHTARLLDITREHNIPITHFVTATFSNHLHLIRRAHDQGNAICLHSHSHDYALIYSSEEAFFADLALISNIINSQIGYAPTCLRFPGGSSNTVSRRHNQGIMTRLSAAVRERGLKHYDWNCSLGDTDRGATVNSMVANVQACIDRGRSPLHILAHDTNAATVDAISHIIPLLLQNGYQFHAITPNTREIHHRIAN